MVAVRLHVQIETPSQLFSRLSSQSVGTSIDDQRKRQLEQLEKGLQAESATGVGTYPRIVYNEARLSGQSWYLAAKRASAAMGGLVCAESSQHFLESRA